MTFKKFLPMFASFLVILLASCADSPAVQPSASNPNTSSDTTASVPSSIPKSSELQEMESMAASRATIMSSEIKADENLLSKIDNKTPYDKLITMTIDLNAFLSLRIPPLWNPSSLGYAFEEYQLRDYVKKFPVECLRKNAKGTVYSVQKVKQGGLLYVFYDLRQYDFRTELEERGDYGGLGIWSWCYVTKLYHSKDFASFNDNSTFDDLIAVDPSMQVIKDYYLANKLDDPDNQDQADLYFNMYLSDGTMHVTTLLSNGTINVSLNYSPDYKIWHAFMEGDDNDFADYGPVLPIDLPK